MIEELEAGEPLPERPEEPTQPEKPEIEITLAKNQELADIIECVKLPLMMIDLPYAKAALKSMRRNVSFRDSAAALNPNYMPEESELQSRQCDMLEKIIEYIEIGKEVDELKQGVAEAVEGRKNMARIFGGRGFF